MEHRKTGCSISILKYFSHALFQDQWSINHQIEEKLPLKLTFVEDYHLEECIYFKNPIINKKNDMCTVMNIFISNKKSGNTPLVKNWKWDSDRKARWRMN